MLRQVFLIILLCLSSIVYAQNFMPQVGDLLFQDLNCGTLCNGINQVTHGINNTYMSHVGIIYQIQPHQIIVAEANSNGVVLTPLTKFLQRSYDKNGRPMVIEERLKPQYQALIPAALTYIRHSLGKKYNADFDPDTTQQFYCSQLIYQAFYFANHDHPLFKTHRMSFIDPHTGMTSRAWQQYFNALHAKVPEGKIGTNPGMMSRDDKLFVVHQYGQLRTHSRSK